MRAHFAVLLMVAACGGDDVAATPIDATIVPPDGFVADAAPSGPGAALSHTLFVNAEGVSLAVGADDATANTSTLVTAPTTLAKFLAADPDRAAKIASIKQQLDGILSPYKVTVTTTRPAAGPYDMIVLTDDTGAKIGLGATVETTIPSSCNSIASELGIGFGVQTDRNHVVKNIISMFGVTAGIPLSNRAADCMCLADTNCATLNTPCTIGGASTVVSASPACLTNASSVDENAEFVGAFGTH